MIDLAALDSDNGFTSGDISPKGYVVVIPAYQTVYFADGRPYNSDISESGYHKLDMIRTSLVGAASGEFIPGEVFTQETSEAAGIFYETVGTGATAKHLVYRTTTTEFDTTNEITGDISGSTLTPTSVKAPPQWLNWILKGSIPDSFDYEGTADSANSTNITDANLIDIYTVEDEIVDYYVYITGGTGSRSYAQITAYNEVTGAITVADWLNSSGEAGGYDPEADSIFGISTEAPSSGGSFPDGGSTIGCLYNGRIFINSVFNPNQWYAFKQRDPLNLDTSLAGESIDAAQSSQTCQAGLVGDALISFIPFKDVYLGFGCANSIWSLNGDPGSTGGYLRNITEETGLFSPDSWCRDNKGNVYIVGLDGFYKLPASLMTDNGELDNISLRLTPGLFKSLSLNRLTDKVVLGFDKVRNIINVSITMFDGSWGTNFAYDVSNDAILPQVYQLGRMASDYLYFNSNIEENRNLLVGCYDGYIRYFDDDIKSDINDEDEEEAIVSKWFAGPIFIGDVIRAGLKIKEVQITLSNDADGLAYKLYAKNSAEDIIEAVNSSETPIASGSFTTGGRQFSIRDKFKGEYVGILFYNESVDSSWAIESVKLLGSYSGQTKD
jgi:hypothetical protein